MTTSEHIATVSPTFDEAEWDAAMAQLEAAQEALDDGRFEEARAGAASVSEALEPVVGATHPDYAHALVVEGDALAALGRLVEALDGYRRALAIYDLYPSGEEADMVRPLRVAGLQRLGYQLSLAGRYEEAERLLREAVSEGARVYGEHAPELADHLNALAVCLRFAARYDQAAEVYAQAAELRDRAGLAQPPTHFHNLSGLASARGDYAGAEVHARAAIALRRELGEHGFELATDLCGLGDALAGLSRNLEAEATYREALALFAASARPQHPEVAFAHHNHGDALAALGRGAEAEAAYRQAIELKAEALGQDHYETAATLNNLAALLSDLGRADEAQVAAEEAVSIMQSTLPADHPHRVACESLARSLPGRAPAR